MTKPNSKKNARDAIASSFFIASALLLAMGPVLLGSISPNEAYADEVQSKRYDWYYLHEGHCLLIQGVLTLYKDGHATWSTNVGSFGSDDAWGISFDLTDRQGNVLYVIKQFWGPPGMAGGNIQPWENANLSFPAYLFDSITGATPHNHC